MVGKRKQEYVVCRRCGQLVRADRFERHALMHWMMSSSDKGFREFLSEVRGETVEAPGAEAQQA